MKLLLDEHYSPAIAEQLTKRRHDVIAAVDVSELKGLEDAEILAWAVARRRALVSENATDLIELHRLYLSRGDMHYGIVLTSARRFPRSRAGIGRLVRALHDLLEQSPTEGALRADLRWLREGEAG